MDVSIIIVNYNTLDLTKQCIESVFTFTSGLDFEIILVDNGSTDGSKECFEEYIGIKYIYSHENLGFGRANNLGVKYASGEFLLLLNSDTCLIENSIKKFISFFKANEVGLKLGVIGAILVDEKLNPNGFGNSFPTCSKEIQRLFRVIPIINTFLPVRTIEYDFDREYFEIDYVIGADMFMRKSLFDQMNGFSSVFFMYYEESDLQKRIADMNLTRYITTKTNIIHLEEGSGKVIINYSNRKRIIAHKSRVMYLKRNDKKDFSKFVFFDFLFLMLSFLNFKYTFKENLEHYREITKLY